MEKTRKLVKNQKELNETVRSYIIEVYHEFGYDAALTTARQYLKESNKAQNELKAKDFAMSIRGELSEIFLEVCLLEYVKQHPGTFYVKSLCIARTDGKEGFTELDLTLFTPNKIYLFECKSYSGKKRLIDEGLMVTDRFAPFNVYKQSIMHLDNFRRYLTKARLKTLNEGGAPYCLAMFSFNKDGIADMRDNSWKSKFRLLTEETIVPWLDKKNSTIKEPLWDIQKLYGIVCELDKNSEVNMRKHIQLSKSRNLKH